METHATPSLTTAQRRKTLTYVLRRVGPVPALLLIAALLTLLQLSTAPPLWWDEGWTLTVARNWVETGHYGRFLADTPVSPGLSGAPTVVLPVALSFRLFGVGAWQGRLPGVVFTVVTLWLLYRVTATLYSRRTGVAALGLALVTPMNPELHPTVIGKQVLGEMPALCFLLAGYLLLFRGLEEERIGKVVAAGLLWGLAVITKQQVIPFLTLSTGVVAIVLFRQRDWRRLFSYVIPFLMAAVAFLAWRWFVRTWLVAPDDPVSGVEGLMWVTAFVPTLPSRLVALLVTLIWGLPVVASLAYGARHHLKGPRGLQRLALWSLTTSWFFWYLLLSVGWGRYLFPAAFLSLIFFAGLIKDITDEFDSGTVWTLWQRLRSREWCHLTRPQQMAIFLLWLTMPATLVGLTGTYLRADNSVFQLADYLHTRVSPGALIETYDSEIMFLTDQRYHFPPDQLHVQLNRRTYLGDRSVKINYDPLSADPDYLINGPLSKSWNLYPDEWLAQHFRLEKRFGPYDLLRFVGADRTQLPPAKELPVLGCTGGGG